MKSTISLQDLLTSSVSKEFGELTEELFSSAESPTIAAKTAAFRHFGAHGTMLTLPSSLEGTAISSFVVRSYDIAAGVDAFEQCIDALLARAYGTAVIAVPASTRERRWCIDWYDNVSFAETGKVLFRAVCELLEAYHSNQRLDPPSAISCRFQGWGLGAALSLSMAAAARKTGGCDVTSVVIGGVPNTRRRRYRQLVAALRPVIEHGFSLADFNVSLARLHTETKPDAYGRWYRIVRRSTPRTARGLYKWLRFDGFDRQLRRLLADPPEEALSSQLEAGYENIVVVTTAHSRLGTAAELESLFANWHQQPFILDVEDASNLLGCLPVWALYALSLIEGQAELSQDFEDTSEVIPETASA